MFPKLNNTIKYCEYITVIGCFRHFDEKRVFRQGIFYLMVDYNTLRMRYRQRYYYYKTTHLWLPPTRMTKNTFRVDVDANKCLHDIELILSLHTCTHCIRTNHLIKEPYGSGKSWLVGNLSAPIKELHSIREKYWKKILVHFLFC